MNSPCFIILPFTFQMRQIEENGVDLYAIEEEMALRREQIYTTCQTYKYENILPNTWEFVVDAHHSLVWCKVFKAASSTWIYYFNILGIHILALILFLF